MGVEFDLIEIGWQLYSRHILLCRRFFNAYFYFVFILRNWIPVFVGMTSTREFDKFL